MSEEKLTKTVENKKTSPCSQMVELTLWKWLLLYELFRLNTIQ